MRILLTEKRPDGKRRKDLFDTWPHPGKPTGDQILTRTLYSGVTNGTERNDLLGGNYATPDDKLPAPWGYQNVGEVVEVGPDVTLFKVGDVIFSSANHTEYALIPQVWLQVKLPDNVDRREAALFGMTSVAMRTCRHADIKLGERVLVVGAGIIGQTAAQIAHCMGARVTICDVDDKRLALARSIGAVEAAVNTGGDGWAKHIADGSFDVVIDLAGVPGMEDKMILACTGRGRLLFIAGRDKVSYTFNIGQGREITIRQNSHFDNSDLERLCHLVSTGQVKIKPYLKDVVPVTEAAGIYDKLRDTPDELLGTVFDWTVLDK